MATYGTSAIENTNSRQRLAYMAATRALATGEEDARESLKAVRSVHCSVNAAGPKNAHPRSLSPGFLFGVYSETMAFKSQLLDLALASSVIIDTLRHARVLRGKCRREPGWKYRHSAELAGQTSQNRLNSMQESENALAKWPTAQAARSFTTTMTLKLRDSKAWIATPQFLYVLEIWLNGIKATGSYHRLQVDPIAQVYKFRPSWILRPQAARRAIMIGTSGLLRGQLKDPYAPSQSRCRSSPWPGSLIPVDRCSLQAKQS